MLPGRQVVHMKRGLGLIEEVGEGRLVVRFERDDKVSRFIYPDAFEGFLTLPDVEIQAVVERHLRIKKLVDAEQERRRKRKLQKSV